jgi:hypothetical protein
MFIKLRRKIKKDTTKLVYDILFLDAFQDNTYIQFYHKDILLLEIILIIFISTNIT